MTSAEVPRLPMSGLGRGTRTSRFGVGRRENHDSSAFYDQFRAPVLSEDEEIRTCRVADTLIAGDARDMTVVESKSVALVVTSPPYLSA